MVRINLFPPALLSDQHCSAERVEIMMLMGASNYMNDRDIPKQYTLGKGHQKFFIDKPDYLLYRRFLLEREMEQRGFKLTKRVGQVTFRPEWYPEARDYAVVKERILQRIRAKPNWYRWYGEKKPTAFFERLLTTYMEAE